MPTKYEFGRMSVSCEGYDGPNDPYVLVGSCGVSKSILKVNCLMLNFAHSSNIILKTQARDGPRK